MSDSRRGPAVTVDLVVCHRNDILLIQRKYDPFAGCWALPGGFVEWGEDLDAAAVRELFEETSVVVNAANIEQIGAFGQPNRDPRGHVISVAFLVWVGSSVQPTEGDDARDARWWSLDNLPPLAFDHEKILYEAGLVPRYELRRS